jgi:hypothetical protein
MQLTEGISKMPRTLLKRWRRRVSYHARHADTFFHPFVNYFIIALLVIATIVLVVYTVMVK